MKCKKIKPHLWIISVGYLMLMAGVYLRTTWPEFLMWGGLFTVILGTIGWMGNPQGFSVSGSDEDRHEYNLQMKFKKINPHFWIILVGYLMFMAGVYLQSDWSEFLLQAGVYTILLGVIVLGTEKYMRDFRSSL